MTPTTSTLLADEVPGVEVLGQDECWNLLASAPMGRVAMRTADGVDIFPVNFIVNNRGIYLRSAPGSKLMNLAAESSVAFEVDGRRRRTQWSVVVHGEASRMRYDSDIVASGVLDLLTATSSAKWNYVEITAASISGRRFTTARR